MDFKDNKPESAEGNAEDQLNEIEDVAEPEVAAEPKQSFRDKIKGSMPSMPKLSFQKKAEVSNLNLKPSIKTKIINKLKEYYRVLKITKKPTKEEYKTIVKASGLGILIIGAVGFVIHMIVQVIRMVFG